MSIEDEVQRFLSRLALILQADSIVFDPRNTKTKDFMLREGFWEDDALEVIARLKPEHYKWGPSPDDNGSPGDVWLFFFPYNEMFPPFEHTELYIKLKVVLGPSGDVGIVISFHEVETYE